MYLYLYITRLASNEIFSPSNKIHREVGRAKDLSVTAKYWLPENTSHCYYLKIANTKIKTFHKHGFENIWV